MSSNIQNWLDDELIIVEEKACKNYGNRQQVCQSCVDICPTSAIQLVNQTPTISAKNCVNCGACISECSVLAIQHKSKPYHDLLQQIKTFPSDNITCEQLDSYQKGIKIPCYLYLDSVLLLQHYIGKEEVTIYIGHCQSCEKVELKQIHDHFEKLKEQIKEFGYNISVNFSTEQMNSEEDHVVSGMTRRDLLKQISIKNIRELLLPTKKEGTEEKLKTTDISVEEKLIFKKNQINEILLEKELVSNNMTLNTDEFLNIAEIESCRGCNICEQICPTNAIKWINSGEKSLLMFDTQQCIACKKCQACPDQAIKFLPIDRLEYLNSSKKLLLSLYLKTCVKCGDTFKSSNEEEVCEFCKAQENKDPSRFFM